MNPIGVVLRIRRYCADRLSRIRNKRRPSEQVKDTFDCSWCKAAAESDPDIPYNFPVSEIGGYDKATGEPICENCRDGAVELV